MLVQRIVSALFLVVPIIAAIILAPYPWSTLIGFLLFAVAAWEWSGFIPQASQRQRILTTSFYIALMMGVIVLLRSGVELDLLYVIATLWWVLASICVMRFPFQISLPFIVIGGALVIVPAFAVVADSSTRSVGWMAMSSLLYVFLIVWAADIGAYFVGRQFGRHKLAPSVSPGKTWEGLFGGLSFATLLALVAAYWSGFSMLPVVLLSGVVVLGSVIGDLTVSLFKRNANVKDAGKIFPGHGGVLDRFDSFASAAPVMFCLLWLMPKMFD